MTKGLFPLIVYNFVQIEKKNKKKKNEKSIYPTLYANVYLFLYFHIFKSLFIVEKLCEIPVHLVRFALNELKPSDCKVHIGETLGSFLSKFFIAPLNFI